MRGMRRILVSTQRSATSRSRVVSKIIHRSDISAERWSYKRQMSTSRRFLSLAGRPKRAAPSQRVYVLPYLARGYFDLARYEAALQTVNRLVKIIADHSSMVADTYSLGGDCYAKLGRDADARHYYNLSYAADWIVNYWAISRLAGE